MTEVTTQVPINRAFLAGAHIQNKLHGIIDSMGYSPAITSTITCGIITQALSYYPGSYIETGTRFGGSAIVARAATKTVVTIDPEYHDAFMMVANKVLAVNDIVKLQTRAKDADIPAYEYTVGFIDGDHSYDEVRNDFDLFHGLGVKCFIFDDVDLAEVRHAISDIVWLEKAQLAFFSYPTTAVLVLEQNEKHRWGGF